MGNSNSNANSTVNSTSSLKTAAAAATTTATATATATTSATTSATTTTTTTTTTTATTASTPAPAAPPNATAAVGAAGTAGTAGPATASDPSGSENVTTDGNISTTATTATTATATTTSTTTTVYTSVPIPTVPTVASVATVATLGTNADVDTDASCFVVAVAVADADADADADGVWPHGKADSTSQATGAPKSDFQLTVALSSPTETSSLASNSANSNSLTSRSSSCRPECSSGLPSIISPSALSSTQSAPLVAKLQQAPSTWAPASPGGVQKLSSDPLSENVRSDINSASTSVLTTSTSDPRPVQLPDHISQSSHHIGEVDIAAGVGTDSADADGNVDVDGQGDAASSAARIRVRCSLIETGDHSSSPSSPSSLSITASRQADFLPQFPNRHLHPVAARPRVGSQSEASTPRSSSGSLSLSSNSCSSSGSFCPRSSPVPRAPIILTARINHDDGTRGIACVAPNSNITNISSLSVHDKLHVSITDHDDRNSNRNRNRNRNGSLNGSLNGGGNDKGIMRSSILPSVPPSASENGRVRGSPLSALAHLRSLTARKSWSASTSLAASPVPSPPLSETNSAAESRTSSASNSRRNSNSNSNGNSYTSNVNSGSIVNNEVASAFAPGSAGGPPSVTGSLRSTGSATVAVKLNSDDSTGAAASIVPTGSIVSPGSKRSSRHSHVSFGKRLTNLGHRLFASKQSSRRTTSTSRFAVISSSSTSDGSNDETVDTQSGHPAADSSTSDKYRQHRITDRIAEGDRYAHRLDSTNENDITANGTGNGKDGTNGINNAKVNAKIQRREIEISVNASVGVPSISLSSSRSVTSPRLKSKLKTNATSSRVSTSAISTQIESFFFRGYISKPELSSSVVQSATRAWHSLLSGTANSSYLRAHSKLYSPVTLLYDAFYSHLFLYSPDMKVFFEHAGVKIKATKLIRMVSKSLKLAGSPLTASIKCPMMAKKHWTKFAVRVEHYRPVVESLLYALQTLLAEDYTSEIDIAFRSIFSRLTKMMQTTTYKLHRPTQDEILSYTKKYDAIEQKEALALQSQAQAQAQTESQTEGSGATTESTISTFTASPGASSSDRQTSESSCRTNKPGVCPFGHSAPPRTPTNMMVASNAVAAPNAAVLSTTSVSSSSGGLLVPNPTSCSSLQVSSAVAAASAGGTGTKVLSLSLASGSPPPCLRVHVPVDPQSPLALPSVDRPSHSRSHSHSRSRSPSCSIVRFSVAPSPSASPSHTPTHSMNMSQFHSTMSMSMSVISRYQSTVQSVSAAPRQFNYSSLHGHASSSRSANAGTNGAGARVNASGPHRSGVDQDEDEDNADGGDDDGHDRRHDRNSRTDNGGSILNRTMSRFELSEYVNPDQLESEDENDSNPTGSVSTPATGTTSTAIADVNATNRYHSVIGANGNVGVILMKQASQQSLSRSRQHRESSVDEMSMRSYDDDFVSDISDFSHLDTRSASSSIDNSAAPSAGAAFAAGSANDYLAIAHRRTHSQQFHSSAASAASSSSAALLVTNGGGVATCSQKPVPAEQLQSQSQSQSQMQMQTRPSLAATLRLSAALGSAGSIGKSEPAALEEQDASVPSPCPSPPSNVSHNQVAAPLSMLSRIPSKQSTAGHRSTLSWTEPVLPIHEPTGGTTHQEGAPGRAGGAGGMSPTPTRTPEAGSVSCGSPSSSFTFQRNGLRPSTVTSLRGCSSPQSIAKFGTIQSRSPPIHSQSHRFRRPPHPLLSSQSLRTLHNFQVPAAASGTNAVRGLPSAFPVLPATPAVGVARIPSILLPNGASHSRSQTLSSSVAPQLAALTMTAEELQEVEVFQRVTVSPLAAKLKQRIDKLTKS